MRTSILAHILLITNPTHYSGRGCRVEVSALCFFIFIIFIILLVCLHMRVEPRATNKMADKVFFHYLSIVPYKT